VVSFVGYFLAMAQHQASLWPSQIVSSLGLLSCLESNSYCPMAIFLLDKMKYCSYEFLYTEASLFGAQPIFGIEKGSVQPFLLLPHRRTDLIVQL
jgi:hypothetical protein